MRGAWMILLMVGLLGGMADPARAHEDSPEANAARRAYSDGAQLYREGRYSDALARFQAGYALRPDPVFLFNIAQCYRRLGQSKKAITTYEAYLEQPNIVNRQQIESLLAEERAKLGLPAWSATSDSAGSSGAQVEARDGRSAATHEPAPAEARTSRKLWLGLGIAGLAAGAVAVAAGGYALSLDGRPGCDLPPPRQCRELLATLPGGATAIGLGGAAMLGGAVSLYFAMRSPQKVAVLPAYFASGAGLTAAGRF